MLQLQDSRAEVIEAAYPENLDDCALVDDVFRGHSTTLDPEHPRPQVARFFLTVKEVAADQFPHTWNYAAGALESPQLAVRKEAVQMLRFTLGQTTHYPNGSTLEITPARIAAVNELAAWARASRAALL